VTTSSPRGEVLAGGLALRLANVFKDAPTSLHIGCSGIGEFQAPRRAREQPGSEMVFQVAQLPAERRHRHFQLATGSRHAAALDRVDQDCHRFEPVHDLTIFQEAASWK